MATAAPVTPVTAAAQTSIPCTNTGYESATALANTQVSVSSLTPTSGLVNAIGGICVGLSKAPAAPLLVTLTDNSTNPLSPVTVFQTYINAAGNSSIPFPKPMRNNTASDGGAGHCQFVATLAADSGGAIPTINFLGVWQEK